MKQSEIELLKANATACFERHGWALPPEPDWDITDFGLRDYKRHGLVLVNLAQEPEYCEKLMYAERGMTTPAHRHHKKKEDIIARAGSFQIKLWSQRPNLDGGVSERQRFSLKVNGRWRDFLDGDVIELGAGERITIVPGVFHEFWATSAECVLGEVSTQNDDTHDNDFVSPEIGRFPEIEDDR